MPDNPSDRERLLRLIDGGTEAIKEIPAQEPAAKVVTPPLPPPSSALSHTTRLLADWTKKMPVLSTKQQMRLVLGLLILAAVVAVLHYGSEMLKTLKTPAKAAVSSETSHSLADMEDESGIGLRLVGVDTSDTAPVALLEDLKTGKTYFARLNERVKGARVKQIQKNKVTIAIHGKNVELR